MILFRCFAWNRSAPRGAPDTPAWFPRPFQGDGRHDNPDAYGCLYLSDRAVSCVAEQFAAFRGQRLLASLLRRRGLPLALAEIDLDDDAVLVDLDEPETLRREGLRPSVVATRERRITQPQALALYRHHPRAAGLKWWSMWEARWSNVTLFDRASGALTVMSVRALTADDPVVGEAADLFGLRRA